MNLRDGLNITRQVAGTVDGRAHGERLGENLTLARIVSEVVHELETQRDTSEAEYEQFLTDVWVGVVLTLMVLSCVCCMCSCLLYHKFQQWKRHVLEQRAAASGDPYRRGGDTESLPSYTLVSGLPSYEEALKQLEQAQGPQRDPGHVAIGCGKLVEAVTASPPCPASLHHCGFIQPGQMSIAELLQLYKLRQQQQQDHQNGPDSSQQQRIAKV